MLADQLHAIAQRLRGAGSSVLGKPLISNPPAGASIAKSACGADDRDRFVDMARRTYMARRQRGALFDNVELFGEPAWDILLDLYVAYSDGKDVSVSSACIGSAAPSTTGLRWLGILCEEGLLVRQHDPDDQRRILVHLSGRGLAAMDTYFAAAACELPG